MNYRNLLCLCLIGFSLIIDAQTDFRPGYIVKNNGDTLQGQIDYRGDLFMNSICRFKSENKDITIFSPDEISYFKFIDSKSYISELVEGKEVFLQQLIIGRVSIYYMRNSSGDHYFIEKEGFSLLEIPYKEEVRVINDKIFLYQSKEHIGILIKYMKDSPEIYDKIYIMKKPGYGNLLKLAEDYHNILCKNENCIQYIDESRAVHVYVEPFIGITNYINADKLSFEFGSYLYLGAPHTNEKLYFKTGISLYDNINVFKIPLQIQYIYPGKKFMPRASFGVNFLSVNLEDNPNIEHTMSINGGLNYRVNDTFNIGFGINTDYTPLTLIMMDPDLKFDILSYSFNLGFNFKLR